MYHTLWPPSSAISTGPDQASLALWKKAVELLVYTAMLGEIAGRLFNHAELIPSLVRYHHVQPESDLVQYTNTCKT